MRIKELGDGLLLRHATPADADALSAFNGRIHAGRGVDFDDGVAVWTRDLLTRPHPTLTPADVVIVEDTANGRIVSSLNLISQTWSYGGIPFGVGRIELVGTAPEYRRKGLVREQFDVVHGWSRQRGELAQGITGIPWYYRQFGYEYALALDGGRSARRSVLPDPAQASGDAYRVRPATPDDIPFLRAVDDASRARLLVSALRDAAMWRYELDGRSTDDTERFAIAIIESRAGAPAGFIAHAWRLIGGTLMVRACELAAGASWLSVIEPLLRYLRAAGEGMEQRPAAARFENVWFLVERDHPLYGALPERLAVVVPSYAWYIRVPDLPAFVRRVAPVLEARLATSAAAGHTGDVLLDFYRSGLRIAFDQGRLTAAQPWPEADRLDAAASFPDLTFLQLLFGHRSLDELESFFPDCSARTEEGRVLVNALFPKSPSFVWPVA